MTTNYCPNCQSGAGFLELKKLGKAGGATVYRCQRCLIHRIEKSRFWSPPEIKDISHEEALKLFRNKKIKALGAVASIIAISLGLLL